MLARIKSLQNQYPQQFWLLFWGMLISTSGVSMIWPFLTIYIREKLQVDLTTVTLLMTLDSAFMLVSSFLAGPIVDKLGRKWIMAVSLIVSGFGYFIMSNAETLIVFAILMCLRGAFSPLYVIGANTMVTDLVEEEKRIDAFSLLRMINNAGVAIGPMIGGFLAATSYNDAFLGAAACLILFGILIAFFTKETLPLSLPTDNSIEAENNTYLKIFRDRIFVSFLGSFTLVRMASILIFVLLSVYAKENFSVPENQFGFVMATNALMVVFLQLPITKFTQHMRPWKIMTIAGLFYAVGIGSVAFGKDVWGFIISMIIMTTGELMLMPNASTLVANIAPTHMRGRYMSVFNLTTGVARGTAPVIGGWLNDQIAPIAIWYGGALMALLGSGGFKLLDGKRKKE
jgi:MFS family permease